MTVKSLEGKRILVTGASGGIGAAIAEIIVSAGASVGHHYFKNGDSMHDRIVDQKISTVPRFYEADLRSVSSCYELIDSFVADCDGIDALVNCAGVCAGYKDLTKLDAGSWDETFNVNTRAPFFLMARMFGILEKSLKTGRSYMPRKVLNISTAAVKRGGGRNNIHYVASKAALDSLTRGFAQAGVEKNILVNSIQCGVIDSGMAVNVRGYSQQRYRKRRSLIPLKRAGKPTDIAEMAKFLLAQTGDFITGETFVIAGGE